MASLTYDREAEGKCVCRVIAGNYGTVRCACGSPRNSTSGLPGKPDIGWFRAHDCPIRRGSAHFGAAGARTRRPPQRGISIVSVVAPIDMSKRRIGGRDWPTVNKAAQLSAFSSRLAGWIAREPRRACVAKTT
jgi:hypothetical protein